MAGDEQSGIDAVDVYLAALPEDQRACLERLRSVIRKEVPSDATEKISYGVPSFQYLGGVVWYAGFKKHCSMYPINSEILTEWAADLEGFSTDKGTIRFTPARPLPEAFVRAFVSYRVADNRARDAARQEKRRAKRKTSAG